MNTPIPWTLSLRHYSPTHRPSCSALFPVPLPLTPPLHLHSLVNVLYALCPAAMPPLTCTHWPLCCEPLYPVPLPCRYVPGTLTSYPDRLIRYKTFFDCDHPYEAAAPEGAPNSDTLDPYLDNAAPRSLAPSFRILATLYLAMALLALLYGI